MSLPLSMPTPIIRVAVEHEDPLVAVGLNTVLRQQCGIEVVPAEGSPDVVVADLRRGVWLAGKRSPQPPRTGLEPLRVMVVAARDREHDVRSALEAGVDGFLEIGCGVQEFVGGVRQLARGARFLSAAAASRIADSVSHAELTMRERQVLALAVQGQSNKAIARALAISVSTVKVHMRSIMGKLGAATRTEAARIAVERGLAG